MGRGTIFFLTRASGSALAREIGRWISSMALRPIFPYPPAQKDDEKNGPWVAVASMRYRMPVLKFDYLTEGLKWNLS